ncbi:MAG: tryptophan--tRNA ligase [Calditrichaeota bacterium]|nr:tryptophan--tRNA ligase [Calditrichota bacterium]MCB0268370.1 tryptophan--tRNA ligase [Calditrichota bacterium]
MLDIKNKRILSGIQPSGILHIGNYFGAIRQHIALQANNDCYYFVANYHAMTTIRDHKILEENSLMVAIDYLALGFDPDKAVLFMQSDVREVTELAWMLSTVTPMGLLERAHSFKDKIAKGIAPNHGLFAYPVLMAADILIYDSDYVPVGKDQKQHLEMTRDMAEKFNLAYGEGSLKLPEDLIIPDVAVVPGLDGQKMSKSYDNIIEIFASKKQMKKKIMSILTDSTPLEDPKNPDDSIIIDLYKLVATTDEVADMRQKFLAGGFGYGHAKKELLEKMWAYFEPYHERREELLNNRDYVAEVLRNGALKAREAANIVMDRVRKAGGLLRFV